MRMKIKYLTKPAIEAEAGALLADFGHTRSPVAVPPVPVDDILESGLRLSLDLDNLPEMLGVAGALEATWVSTREVFVDQSLDPAEYPHNEGLYNETLGHAIGHWQLHRSYVSTNPPGSFCCIPSSARILEREADYFSWCLLMPRLMVFDAWHSRANWSDWTVASIASPCASACCTDGFEYGAAACGMAHVFRVTVPTMQRRLEELGLVTNTASQG